MLRSPFILLWINQYAHAVAAFITLLGYLRTRHVYPLPVTIRQNPQGQMLLVLLGLHHYCIHHYTVTFANRKGDGTPHRLRKSFTGGRPTVTLPGLSLGH